MSFVNLDIEEAFQGTKQPLSFLRCTISHHMKKMQLQPEQGTSQGHPFSPLLLDTVLNPFAFMVSRLLQIVL